jgi:ATP-binding cassette subfamily B protein/subfamily B ATP-binding cassette protein MsbA
MLPSRDSSKSRYRAYREKAKSKAAERLDPQVEAQMDRLRNKPTNRDRGFFTLLGLFWQRTSRHRPAIIFALCTLTLTTMVGLAVPASTKIALDYILTDNPGPTGIPENVREAFRISERAIAERTPLLWMLSGIVIAISAFGVLLGTLGRWQMTRVTKRLQVQFRREAFLHAIRLPLHRVHHYKTGGMSSLLREDAGASAELGFNILYNPWRAIVQLTGTLIILAFTDLRMLVGGLLLVPIVWVTHKTWIARIRPLYRDAKAARQTIDASVTESFAGIRVVRGFGRAHSEAGRFVTGQHYMTRIEILTWWWSRIVEIAWHILIPLASAAVLIYGGTQVLNKNLTIGDLMMFSTYLLMLLGPLETLTSTATTVQTNLAAFDRILSLLEEPEEFATTTDRTRPLRMLSPAKVRAEVQIENLSFAYPRSAHTGRDAGALKPLPEGGVGVGGSPASAAANPNPEATASPNIRREDVDAPTLVLHDLTLHIKAGETIALVGPSGAGKTTLCNLIARFYDPTRGRILLDGTDLRDIDIASYRRILGIVEQDVFLFDGSVAENIAYANRNATPERIQAAAQAAHAHEFIAGLERGYATLIGERGVRLSGGQKQRLAIARAILADPRILILDEATSNLDSESEQLIQRSLTQLMRERTSIVIAHRLSTIRNADRIVVLDKGRIIEVGPHEELIKKGGLYAHLLHLQVQGAEQLTA